MTRRLSFRARLTLQWTTAFGFLLLLACVAIYVGSRRYAYADLDADVRTLAGTELASAVDDDRGVHLHDFPAESMEHGSYADKFAQIVTGDGLVVRQSGLPDGTPCLIDAARRADALAGHAAVFSVYAGVRPGRMMALRARQGDVDYVVGVGLGSLDVEAGLGQMVRLLAFVWIACVAATGALGYVLASRALAPVERIAASAAAIARGEHHGNLDPPAADDEIGRMTGHLNAMLASLRAAIESNRRFAADASHELRGPLTSIRGEVEVALKRERSPDAYRETLALVGRQAAEMAELADNLMLLVRSADARSDLELAEVPLEPLVRAAVGRVAGMAQTQGVALQVSPFEDLVVHSNERLLSRVLDNLLRNAVQYNRRDGVVMVAAEVEPVAPPAAQRLILRVRDTGCGIDRKDWDRVFEPFYRVDVSRSRRTGGAGLGLAICRDALALLRGEVRIVDSSPMGTTVEMRLPGAPSSHRGLTKAS
jgi:two-component system OmpR family sensor kinase